MKAKWIVRGLVILATLTALSTVIAYRLGYRKGSADERACWILDPAPAEAWFHGQITARRDTVRHPFLKPARPARIVFHGGRNVNSIPATCP